MIPVYSILKTKISAIQYDQILNQIRTWIDQKEHGRYIIAANVHVVMEAYKSPPFKTVTDRADLIVPDGMPLLYIGRWRGHQLKQRAYGPTIMKKVLEISPQKGWSHFFYGSTSETLDLLLISLHQEISGLRVAGTYSPPFRLLSPEEDNCIIETINQSNADILWVGLGCPKQEFWMWQHRNLIKVPVMVGVGQAFDLLAGVKKPTPNWMSSIGLEWAYRLVTEPLRLWKRYLINNPWFIWLVLKEEIGRLFKKK